MKNKLLIALLICALGGLFFAWRQYHAIQSIGSYEECIAAKGSRVLESYPAICITSAGSRFVEPIITDDSSTLPAPSDTYTCPKTKWVDCMPGPDKSLKKECSAGFLTWAKANCPGFQGAAL